MSLSVGTGGTDHRDVALSPPCAPAGADSRRWRPPATLVYLGLNVPLGYLFAEPTCGADMSRVFDQLRLGRMAAPVSSRTSH